MKHFFVVAVTALLTGSALAAGPTATAERIRRVQEGMVPPVLVQGESPVLQTLAARMAELKVPGVSIAVIHEGRIEWARGFGVTRLDGPRVTETTLFQAASISKPVFALAVLHLVEAGKLNLDANVNDYLKDWKLPDNDFTRQSKVTLRGLLSHSAGLTVHGFPGYAAKAPVPTTVQVLDGTPPANTGAIRVDIAPGSIFRYSGGGYVLAQQLLHDVTGVPLPKLMHDSVLAPLRMTRSTYQQPLPAARASEVALPYNGDGKPVEGGPHTYPEMAPAGLWTTPTDLAHYALGVRAALSGESKAVISAATARAMLTPVINNQGLGPQVGGKTARKFFMHSGGNEGYRCLLVAYEDGEGAIVMTNSDNGGELTTDVMRSIAYVYQWPDFAPPVRTLSEVKPESLERFVGAYELNDGSPYVVHKDGDHLVGHIVGNTPLRLFPSSDHEFFARDVDIFLSFSVDAAGNATAVRHVFNGWERTGPRAPEAKSHALLAAVEKSAQRFKEQKPQSGSEAAVRQLLTGLATGKPNYERMSPALADLTRQQLSGLQAFIGNLGAIKTLTFKQVSAAGGDVYDTDFEKGVLRLDLHLSDDGRIDRVEFLPR
jgi:CubicO group peptidase (beta-lactamase class C family)